MIKLSVVLCLSLLCGFCVSIPGGMTPITDEATLTELQNKITTYLEKFKSQENDEQLKLDTLKTAAYQVVAGLLYEINAEFNENNKIVNCVVSILEQPWRNFFKLTVKCGEEDERERTYEWTSDEADTTTEQLPGGFTALDEKSLAELHPKLTNSFIKLRKMDQEFDWTLQRILSGKSQVVAGTRYTLTVEATNSNDEVELCEADIWERTWENFYHVKLTCQGKGYEIIFN